METSNISPLWSRLQSIQLEAMAEQKGLFPSTRFHPLGYRRKDYSAYFTATLLHSLARLNDYLSADEQEVLEQIRQKASEGVSPFQNKQGLQRYNFWQTNPGRHFPNGKFLGRWDYFRPPDDVDDSVMIYQIQDRTREEALWLSQHIDSYANGSKKWIRNTPNSYKKLRAYCTFFSKDMPLGFDACVITNVLYFNLLHNFEQKVQFADSVQYLCLMLEQKDHLNQPQKVAPYYPHTSIILYHLAKLMSWFKIPELEKFRNSIVEDIGRLLQSSLKKPERVMVENAWMWMCKSLPVSGKKPDLVRPFYFFVLPLTLEYEGTVSQSLAHNRLTHIRFHCEALEVAFEIENEVLRKTFGSQKED